MSSLESRPSHNPTACRGRARTDQVPNSKMHANLVMFLHTNSAPSEKVLVLINGCRRKGVKIQQKSPSGEVRFDLTLSSIAHHIDYLVLLIITLPDAQLFGPSRTFSNSIVMRAACRAFGIPKTATQRQTIFTKPGTDAALLKFRRSHRPAMRSQLRIAMLDRHSTLSICSPTSASSDS